MRLIPRDFSSWPPVSGPLWTIATGRFPVSPLRSRPEFPFAPSLEPLFVGFSLDLGAILAEVVFPRLRPPVELEAWSTFLLEHVHPHFLHAPLIDAKIP